MMIIRRLIQILMLLTLLSLAQVGVAAQTGDYNAVVKLVENFYHVKHKGLPLIARVGMKVARPSEVKSFKLATFENQDFSSAGQSDFHAAMKRALGADWQPLVQIRSRADGEQTYVFTREADERVIVLVVTIERRDATVVQAEIEPQALIKWMRDPEQMSRSLMDQTQNLSEP